jgi:hypothetical protein
MVHLLSTERLDVCSFDNLGLDRKFCFPGQHVEVRNILMRVLSAHQSVLRQIEIARRG